MENASMTGDLQPDAPLREYSEKYTDVITAAFVYFSVIDGVIIIPAVGGNIMVIASIIRFRRLWTPMYVLVANLAVSDLIVGAVLVPVDLFFLSRGEKVAMKNKQMCLFQLSLFVTLKLVSVFNLFLISFERYQAIIYPMLHLRRRYKYRGLIIGIMASWTVSIILGFLPTFGVNTWTFGIPCDSQYIFYKQYRAAIYLLIIVFVGGNVFMYIRAIKVAWKRIALTKHERDADETTKFMRSKYRENVYKSKIMFIVLGVFAVCWGPYCITVLLKLALFRNNYIIVIIKKFLAYLGLFNSAINWIIYGVKNKDFRRASNLSFN